nr:uncharacterized protein LOC117277562 [Nicotiana tomentosiformis]
MAETPIDHTHLLYLGPSDTPSSVSIPVKLAGSDNYWLWSRSMRITYLGNMKLGFVSGTCKKDLYKTAELQEQWETCNAVVLSWIMNNVCAELLGGIVYASNHISFRKTYERDLTRSIE